ncbi:MAG: RNA chaperone Hfq [Gammaproteobacteria bacterium]|nr:RNA chaperone Hfq [Gammaproteobacteria bacterium]
MSKQAGNIQDEFLADIVARKVPVNIFLVNGIKLVGTIIRYDQYSVEVSHDISQIVFKRAISTILPEH